MDSYAKFLNRKKDTSIHHQITSNFFGGICDSFFPGFIMQAIDSNKLSATQLEKCIKREVQHPESFYLTVPKEHPVNAESKNTSGSEKQEADYFQLTSVVIKADIDVAKTMIYYGDARTIQEEEMAYPCDLVQAMVERVKSMHSDAILTIQDIYNSIWDTMDNIVRKSIQLEHFMQSQDTSIEAVFNSVLSNVYNKSNKRLLNEIRDYHKTPHASDVTPKAEKVSAAQLVKLLDCEYSDLRLLTNICSITSPSIRGAMGF
uniref:FNIP_C domain-containing protein n=1 Tax=Panagrellus redivivus TaxID=6233 RepID=A0A7E4VL75_PANRE